MKTFAEKYGQWKQAVKDRDKAHSKGKKKKGGRKKRWAQGGNEKLKDVNKPAERRSMQSVGGFRGTHGASRKSKSGQGPAARVEYRRKSPADSVKRKPLPKGTIVSINRKIREFFGGLLPLELTDAALLREKYGDTFDNEKERAKTAEKEKELKKKKLIMQHGKKKYLQLQQQGKKAKEKLTKDPKGIRGTHKGKWGYFKGGKFKSD